MTASYSALLLHRLRRLVDPGSRGTRSIRSISKQMNIQPSTLSRWMSRQRVPSGRSLDRIARWVEAEERAERRP